MLKRVACLAAASSFVGCVPEGVPSDDEPLELSYDTVTRADLRVRDGNDELAFVLLDERDDVVGINGRDVVFVDEVPALNGRAPDATDTDDACNGTSCVVFRWTLTDDHSALSIDAGDALHIAAPDLLARRETALLTPVVSVGGVVRITWSHPADVVVSADVDGTPVEPTWIGNDIELPLPANRGIGLGNAHLEILPPGTSTNGVTVISDSDAPFDVRVDAPAFQPAFAVSIES